MIAPRVLQDKKSGEGGGVVTQMYLLKALRLSGVDKM